MSTVSNVKDRASQGVTEVRDRAPWLDHLIRMQQHYGNTYAAQQAGAITYFAFLSFFPVLAIAFFVVGLVSNIWPNANEALRDAISAMFPEIIGPNEGDLQLSDFRTFSGLAGVLGFVAVLYSGLGWISALRRALGAVFEQSDDERLGFVPGKLRDLATLTLLGLTLLLTVALSGVLSRYAPAILGFFELDEELGGLVSVLTYVLSMAANVALFFWMFRLLGGHEVPNRSLVGGAVLGAVLFEVLKQLAAQVIGLTEGQPAFQAFGLALVVLVWINYFSRLVLYAACWAWTTEQAQEARAELEEPAGEPVQGPPLPSGDASPVLAAAEEPRGGGWRAPFAAGSAVALAAVALTRRLRSGE
ncbi:YihY/virulence factor BrkB family protein [Nocardioides bruguierae]|uniref:YihY/virulence factor BrkB family protein n=1 Tax=Nocardioides bruguierae TaxID=2945102 RepID=A0A9X2D8H1_9ACTN|nr:YihY/virulence factor BrkB family protein [Nocardioides bruguierae]MCL8025200.1 YihY/virulence factor BrkB family protein [Nocardioides bruguierae]MCM0621252.1 YihY/virulence factor BrkB family protein [Nocardioides bruguierae]